MIKLLVFDLDGTLVDSALDIMNAGNEFLKSIGMTPLDFHQVKQHIGEGFSSFVKLAAGEHVKDPVKLKETFDRFQAHYDKRLVDDTRFFEGAEKFLRKCLEDKSHKLGVVSNKPEYQVRRILVELGFEESHFVEIFGGDRFEVKKPDPKPLVEMMKMARVNPHETVMIGDSKADVLAAKSAGTHFIAVSFGYNTRDHLTSHGAEIFLDHFDGLSDLLKTLVNWPR